jgi:hypothetical protein
LGQRSIIRRKYGSNNQNFAVKSVNKFVVKC